MSIDRRPLINSTVLTNKHVIDRYIGLAILSAVFVLATSSAIAQDNAIFSVRVGRYRMQSNPWVNLHQRLMYEARFDDASPVALSGDDLTKWKKAVEAYRAFLGKRNPIFDVELKSLNFTLSAMTSSKLPASVPKAAASVLEAAMPLYLIAQWGKDDSANRFWITVAEPMLASAAEELAEAHFKVYGVPFPKDILIDVSPLAWEFGAYTVGEGQLAYTVMTSTEPGYQGFAALEMLMHEPSHVIVGATSGAIGGDLAHISSELGIKPYSYLWHAILFYTSGELTRRALAKRGVNNYQPSILGMYEHGGYGDLRKSLEKNWQAYLDGKVSREAAIRQLLIETAPSKKL